jgi:pyruvate formate-lyase/glycerol dehydratase family glycyl radical enzyme
MPTFPLPSRIQRLIERFPPTGKEKTWYPNGADERGLLLWQYFQIAAEQPLPLRCACGLDYVMEHIAIAIHPDELIIGEVGLDDVTQTQPQMHNQANAYWQRRSEQFSASFSWHGAELQASIYGLSSKWASRDGHAIPAFDFILANGLKQLCRIAKEAIAQEAPDLPGAAERNLFRQAMILSIQALTSYIQRYATLARAMASTEPEPGRREELLHAAERCAFLANQPPRTFLEALQLVWFIHLGIKLDDGGVGHSFGRFDQYLLPFYQADLAAGRLNPDQARELLALFWLKLNRECDDIAHLSLGGLNPDGTDAQNELSVLCLEVERWISRKQPNLSTRVHKDTRPAYWHEIAETIRCGAGHPAVFNDDVIVPGLLDYALPLDIAREYAQVGCVETFFPGLAAPWTDCYLNLAKCLELALNDGRDILHNTQIGPHSGKTAQLLTFPDLFQAYETQVNSALCAMLAAKDEYDAAISQHAPEPLNSAFIHDCLKRGLDASGGGARYLLTGAYGVGLGTTVDSLAALHEIVYAQKMAPLEDLVNALHSNFNRAESLRQFCLNRAPKYGNDIAEVDALAVAVVASFGKQVKAYSDTAWQAQAARDPSAARHAYHFAMFGSVLHHTGMGALTAASANGRLAGQTLSDGGSPAHGANRSGATATLRSLAKPDYRLAPGGAALNLRLSPAHFSGEEGLERLSSLLCTYFAMGGEQIQVNLLSAETLRSALAAPDAYRDLVVRVAGFTAYFVSLNPALQAEVIARAEG